MIVHTLNARMHGNVVIRNPGAMRMKVEEMLPEIIGQEIGATLSGRTGPGR